MRVRQVEKLQNKTGNKQTVTLQTRQNKCTFKNMLPNMLHVDFYHSLNVMLGGYFGLCVLTPVSHQPR